MKLVIEVDLTRDKLWLVATATRMALNLMRAFFTKVPATADLRCLLDNRPDEQFVVLTESLPNNSQPEDDEVRARIVITRAAFDKTNYSAPQAAKNNSQLLHEDCDENRT